MSDPTDQNPPDPHSDLSDDKDLSSLYARGRTEQPSDALDQAILEKARKATARHAARTHRVIGPPPREPDGGSRSARCGLVSRALASL